MMAKMRFSPIRTFMHHLHSKNPSWSTPSAAGAVAFAIWGRIKAATAKLALSENSFLLYAETVNGSEFVCPIPMLWELAWHRTQSFLSNVDVGPL